MEDASEVFGATAIWRGTKLSASPGPPWLLLSLWAYVDIKALILIGSREIYPMHLGGRKPQMLPDSVGHSDKGKGV